MCFAHVFCTVEIRYHRRYDLRDNTMTIKVKILASSREVLPRASNRVGAVGIETITEVWNVASDGLAMSGYVLYSVNLEHR